MKIKSIAISLWLRQPSVNSNLHFEKNFKVEDISGGLTLSWAGMSVFGSLALSYALVPGETFQNRLRRDSLENKIKHSERRFKHVRLVIPGE